MGALENQSFRDDITSLWKQNSEIRDRVKTIETKIDTIEQMRGDLTECLRSLEHVAPFIQRTAAITKDISEMKATKAFEDGVKSAQKEETVKKAARMALWISAGVGIVEIMAKFFHKS